MAKQIWAPLGTPELRSERIRREQLERNAISYLARKPIFQIVTAHRNELTYRSLQAQSYPHFKITENSELLPETDFLIFLEPGDELHPATLFQFASEISRNPKLKLLFCNEIRNGHFLSKGPAKWFNLIHFDAIGRAFAVAKEELGLSHLQMLEKFGESAFSLLPYFLLRSPAPLSEGNHTSSFIPKLENPKSHRVSVVICFRDRVEWTEKCLTHLQKFSGDVPVEAILVNNNSTPETVNHLHRFLEAYSLPWKWLDFKAPFNFAEMHNKAIRELSSGDFIFALNNDVFLEEGNLDRMVAWAAYPWVGTVGLRLHFPNGAIQHGGFRLNFGGRAWLGRVTHETANTPWIKTNRIVLGNTYAAALFRKEVFEKCGGLRAVDLPNGFGDVAFNLECMRVGLSNLYLGEIAGTHLESATRGANYEAWEEFVVERDYGDLFSSWLRCDFGIDRIPKLDLNLKNQIRRRYPWVKKVQKFLGK